MQNDGRIHEALGSGDAIGPNLAAADGFIEDRRSGCHLNFCNSVDVTEFFLI